MFFDHVVCKFGILKDIISDHDTRFVSEFWTTLMAKLGIKIGLFFFLYPHIILRQMVYLRGAAGNTSTIESMPTRGILHTCVLAVTTSGISHHKFKVTL